MMNVIAILPALIPSTILGVVIPLLELKKQGKVKLTIVGSRDAYEKDLGDYDLAVLCRNCEYEDLRTLKKLVDNGVPYIYELDDNFFRIPTSSPIGRYHRDPFRIFTTKKLLEHAALVRCYSKVLHDDLVKLTDSDVFLTRAFFDFELIEKLERKKSKKKKSKVRIAFATSRATDHILNLVIVPALRRIFEKHRNRVELITFGNIKVKGLEKYKKNIKHVRFTASYGKYIRSFYKANVDIGLAPLSSGLFENSKTDNKFREYAGCKAAGIYSDVPIYSNSVDDGETGLLVENSEDEWFSALDKLVSDTPFRKQVIDSAYAKAKKRYCKNAYVSGWEECLKLALDKKEPWSSTRIPDFTNKTNFNLIGNFDKPLEANIKSNIMSAFTNRALASIQDVDGIDYAKSRKGFDLNAIFIVLDEVSVGNCILSVVKSEFKSVIIITTNHYAEKLYGVLSRKNVKTIILDDTLATVQGENYYSNEKNDVALHVIDDHTVSAIASVTNFHRDIFEGNKYINLYDALFKFGCLDYKEEFESSLTNGFSNIFNLIVSRVDQMRVKFDIKMRSKF